MPGFSGQGIISIAPRLPAGLPGIWRDIGNASVCKMAQSVESVERRESRTGARLPFRRLTNGQGGKLQIVGDEFNKENFALATLGVATSVLAGAAVPGFVLPAGVKVGDILTLPGKNVSAVAVKDSTTGTAKVMVAGTNYVLDPFAGSIKILDLTVGGVATVQPFKADFTPGAVDVIGAFKSAQSDYYVRCDGINTDDNNARGICDFFRVRFDTTKAIDLISNDYLDWDLDGTVLADLTRLATSPDGQYFSWTQAAAA